MSEDSQSIMAAYAKADYDTLATLNLRSIVDRDGNTIVHLMAKRLDKNGFNKILAKNPLAISYDMINMPNANNQLPIQLAWQTIQTNNTNNDQFLYYLVNVLGANPMNNKQNNRSTLTKLNDLVKSDIKQLSNTVMHTFNKNEGKEIQPDPTQFIARLTDAYLKGGGYWENKPIDRDASIHNNVYDNVSTDVMQTVEPALHQSANYFKITEKPYARGGSYDDTSDDDSYNDVSTTQSTNANYRQPRPKTSTDMVYDSFVKTIMNLLEVDLDTAKFYRCALKIDLQNRHPELRGRKNDPLRTKEMEKFFQSKAKLQSALDKIDKEAIKEYQRARAEEAKTKKNNLAKIPTTQDTSSNNQKIKSKANKQTADHLSKKSTSKNKQSRIDTNNYIKSDEILFSP